MVDFAKMTELHKRWRAMVEAIGCECFFESAELCYEYQNNLPLLSNNRIACPCVCHDVRKECCGYS